jgi:hypothetical protein
MRGALLLTALVLAASVAGCLASETPDAADEPALLADDLPWYLQAIEVEGGATFDAALALDPVGLYAANLSVPDHFYKFSVAQGEPINIEFRVPLKEGYLPAPDNDIRPSFRLLDPNGILLDTPLSNQAENRVMIPAASIAGDYRLHVTEDLGGFQGAYRFCFLLAPPAEHPCPDIQMAPLNVIMGGSLPRAHTNVLLIPPLHGDLGNPSGPSGLDYLDATIAGIHDWMQALHRFGEDYPEYSYLKSLSVHVAVFDGLLIPSDIDIVVVYVETSGPHFRGAATECLNAPRCVVLSLFATATRSGQALPDYPELNDIEAVTKHEFAHVWGLGHTLTWTEEHGPDLMNSPYPRVYGDGDPLGDGGERTPKVCISTLNLYVMAQIYAWLDGHEKVSEGEYVLPDHIAYEWYC